MGIFMAILREIIGYWMFMIISNFLKEGINIKPATEWPAYLKI